MLCYAKIYYVRLCNSGHEVAYFYSRMCSVMGRNVQYYCERFGVFSLDVIDSSKQ